MAVTLPGDGDEVGPFRAVGTPGHSADSVCLVMGRVCFTGDTVLGTGSVFIAPGEGSLSAYLDSLRRLRSLDLEVLCPGHGPSSGTRPRSSTSTSRTDSIANAAARGARAGLRSEDELLDAAWPEVPAELRGAAALTLAAHLEKLSRSGRLPARPALKASEPGGESRSCLHLGMTCEAKRRHDPAGSGDRARSRRVSTAWSPGPSCQSLELGAARSSTGSTRAASAQSTAASTPSATASSLRRALDGRRSRLRYRRRAEPQGGGCAVGHPRRHHDRGHGPARAQGATRDQAPLDRPPDDETHDPPRNPDHDSPKNTPGPQCCRSTRRAAQRNKASRTTELTDPLWLHDLIERYPRRPGLAAIRALLQEANAAEIMSELEERFQAFLINAGIPLPRPTSASRATRSTASGRSSG